MSDDSRDNEVCDNPFDRSVDVWSDITKRGLGYTRNDSDHMTYCCIKSSFSIVSPPEGLMAVPFLFLYTNIRLGDFLLSLSVRFNLSLTLSPSVIL